MSFFRSFLRASLSALACLALLGGCAVYSEAERAQLSRQGLAPATLAKLEHRRPLDPEDLIELRRRQVPDALTIRQLRRVGVDSLFTRADILHLRSSGVRPAVIDATIRASNEFADDHGHGPDAVQFDGGYAEPYGWHGSVGFGFGAAF